MKSRKLAVEVADTPRTPREFLERINALVEDGRDREALAFAKRFGAGFLPQLTTEELNRLEGAMEGAQMIVDLQEWERAPAPATSL